jgi:pyoverdine/dityrosine biosynthesis protein Dit1
VCIECSAKHSSDYQTKLRKLIHSKRAEINAQGNVQEVR